MATSNQQNIDTFMGEVVNSVLKEISTPPKDDPPKRRWGDTDSEEYEEEDEEEDEEDEEEDEEEEEEEEDEEEEDEEEDEEEEIDHRWTTLNKLLDSQLQIGEALLLLLEKE